MHFPVSRKLGQYWMGPFTVVSSVGPMAYKLDLLPDLCIHLVSHISQLKGYVVPEDYKELGIPNPTVVEG